MNNSTGLHMKMFTSSKLICFAWLLAFWLPTRAEECGPVDFHFSVYDCHNATTMGRKIGNCTNANLLGLYLLYDCGVEHQYCHECGFNKAVCSTSTNSDTACADFPGFVPTNLECSTENDGFMFADQCTSSTGYALEVVDCHGGEAVKRNITMETCGSTNPELEHCMDCDGIGYCHGGDPATTTCDMLRIQGVTEPNGVNGGSMAPWLSLQVPMILVSFVIAKVILL